MGNSAPEYGQEYGALSRAAGMVTDAEADFMRISNNLTSQIMGIQSQWQGSGGSAFFTLHQQWTDKQRIIIKALNDFAHSLHSTETLNMNNDDTITANMNGLKNRLG